MAVRNMIQKNFAVSVPIDKINNEKFHMVYTTSPCS